jgi:hypothetical protein
MIEEAGAGLVMLTRNKLAYMDLAMTPATDDEDLEMFHTPSGPAFLEQEQRRLQANEHKHEHAAVA